MAHRSSCMLGFGTASALLILAGGCSGLGKGGDGSFAAPGPRRVDPAADANDGDRFAAVGTNPFVVTAHDPLSTFGVDVDTASFDIFRRDVNLGLAPEPASVRLEEYVNNFEYAYPAPSLDAPHPFAISLSAAGDMFHRGTVLLRVGVRAVAPPPSQKRPANIVFLVDVSGSMSAADKLPLVQRMLTRTLTILAPDDRVSIVTYAGSTGVRLEPTSVREAGRIAAVIEGLSAGGSTAGAAALTLAYEQAQRGLIEGGINHVVLCTDGDFNVGPSSTDELLAMIKRERLSGVTLTALGFGVGNLNDQMLEAVSNAGNGIYGMISSAAQADRYVDERMLSPLMLVAQNMKVQVELNPARVLAYRLLGYENRAIADDDFRDDAVDGGEIGAGHRVTALYELVPVGHVLAAVEGAPPMVDGAPASIAPEVRTEDLALVKVRYQPVGSAQDAPALEVRASLAAAEVGLDLQSGDADLRWATAVAAYAEILKQSPYADRESLPLIEAILNEQAGRDDGRAEMAQLFAKAKPILPSR